MRCRSCPPCCPPRVQCLPRQVAHRTEWTRIGRIQPLEGAAGHCKAFSAHLVPDLVGALDLRIGLPGTLDLRRQGRIALCPCAAQCRVALTRCMTQVTRWGNLQDLADRLDPIAVAVLVDKVLQDLSLRSSSAWAKKALANLRISSARRNSLFSRSRVLTRSRSSVVTPARVPLSI